MAFRERFISLLLGIQHRFYRMNELKIIKPTEVESHVLPGSTRVKRFITQEEDSSCFTLGLATIDVGADHAINVTRQEKDEAYYMLNGKLSMVIGEKKLEAKEGDVVLFRSGRGYKVTNNGNEPAKLLYVICPSAK